MRAFIALELPQTLRERLAEIAGALRVPGAKVRWVTAENIHLTLKFLGDIGEDQAEAMKAAVREAARETRPLKLAVGDLGAFPNRRSPRVIWVGIQPHERLAALQARLEEAAEQAGVARDERRFSPHLTLGRVKYLPRRNNLTSRLREVRVERFYYEMEWVTLFRSDLEREGARYTALERAKLGG